MTNVCPFIVDTMKFIGIAMYSFKISLVGDAVEVSTPMSSFVSPRMALENDGFIVEESCFKKGDISISYFPHLDKSVNVNVWKGDTLLYYIHRAEFISVFVDKGYVFLTTPKCKVTVNVD